MRVHQVLSGAGPHDAVTTQALAFRALFRAWGWGGGDVAAEIDPRVGSAVAPLRTLAPMRRDVLLIHYSAYAPKLRGVEARRPAHHRGHGPRATCEEPTAMSITAPVPTPVAAACWFPSRPRLAEHVVAASEGSKCALPPT